MVNKFPTLIKDVCACTKSLKLFLTLCDPMDRGLPGPLSMGFARQEYCSGLPYPSPSFHITKLNSVNRYHNYLYFISG